VVPGKKAAQPAAQSIAATPFGQPGDAKKAARTLTIRMSDRMRYTPDHIQVNAGDTLRLVVKNEGKVMHELVLGRAQDLKAHAELMKKHTGMEHDEPYMAHVVPGKSETIVWQFTKAGEFQFGCLIPGHFEAGMSGRITVK
jgi:uncharacterized cupredoxin-like copper-binding protein